MDLLWSEISITFPDQMSLSFLEESHLDIFLGHFLAEQYHILTLRFRTMVTQSDNHQITHCLWKRQHLYKFNLHFVKNEVLLTFVIDGLRYHWFQRYHIALFLEIQEYLETQPDGIQVNACGMLFMTESRYKMNVCQLIICQCTIFSKLPKLTFEGVDIEFLPDTKCRLNVLPLHALDAKVRKWNSHIVLIHIDPAHTVAATFLAHQIVRMWSKLRPISCDAGDHHDRTTLVSRNLQETMLF